MKKFSLSPGFRCALCVEQGFPSHFASEPNCAFSTGVFSTENWACRTAIALRHLVPEELQVWHEDQNGALLPIGDCGSFLILGWYKRRGRQEYLGILKGSEVKPLTLALAEAVLADRKGRLVDELLDDDQ